MPDRPSGAGRIAAAAALAGVERASQLEQQVSDAFDEHVFILQRRTAELQALGFTPQRGSARRCS